MKRIFTLSACFIAFCSCQAITEVELQDSICSDEFVTITATLENPTKTVLDSDMETVLWKPAETIKVFSDGESAVFTSTNKVNTATADFNGNITIGKDIFGVYPSTGATFSNGHINTTLPGAQIAQENSFSDKLLITAGHSTDLNLKFYNVCSGLRFTLEQKGIRTVTIKSLDNTPLAGNIAIDFREDGKPFISNISNPKTEITVFAPNYGVFETGKWYYIVLLSDMSCDGISFYFFDGDKRGERSLNTRSVNFKRSIFKQAEKLDAGVEMIECAPLYDEIWYITTDCEPISANDTYENGMGIVKSTGPIKVLSNMSDYRIKYAILPEGLETITGSNFPNVRSITVPSTVRKIKSYGLEDALEVHFKGAAPTLDLMSDDEGDPYYVCYDVSAILYVKPEYYQTFLNNWCSRYNYYLCNVELETPVPNNEIWYTTTDENIVTLSNVFPRHIDFGADVVSNTYVNGVGKIVFNGEISQIGNNAFYYVNNLESIFLPESVTTIGRSSFAGCSGLKTVYLPKGLELINTGAFESCTSLTKIVIPNDTSFKDYSSGEWVGNPFNLCNHLTGFFHNGQWVTTIVWTNTLIAHAGGISSFYNELSSNNNWNYSIIGDGALANCPINSFVISASCTEIGNSAFLNCNKLTTVTIPDQCYFISTNAFYGCTELKSIRVERTTPPSGNDTMFGGTTCPIYVPSSALNAYKTAYGWSNYASRIVGY